MSMQHVKGPSSEWFDVVSGTDSVLILFLSFRPSNGSDFVQTMEILNVSLF